jgi:membrane peptidoglycan carboxypeptidase
MKPLNEQEPKLKIPRFRAALIRLHSDLLQIDKYVQREAAYYPTSLTSLEKLVLVLEDRRFLNHHGVDLIGTFREILRAITFRRHGGASTIDMQFVRTATGYRQRTFRRKLYEILLAVIIQFRYSKIIILRSYLACAFFGSHITGANSAAIKLYCRTADDLSIDEAAFLAAMLVYPGPLLPTPGWQSRIERRASYGKRIYIANKDRFDKLPS